MIIDGCGDEKSTADRLASAFQSMCVPNTVERHKHLFTKFTKMFAHYKGSCIGNDVINVEIVQKCISELKLY